MDAPFLRKNTHLIPLSVNNVGSNCRMLFSKKSLLMPGSKSGSSPISFENHLKQASRSDGKTACSARHCQICFACSAHSQSWPSRSKKRRKFSLSWTCDRNSINKIFYDYSHKSKTQFIIL